MHLYVVDKEDAPERVVLQESWGVDYEVKNHAVKVSQLGIMDLKITYSIVKSLKTLLDFYGCSTLYVRFGYWICMFFSISVCCIEESFLWMKRNKHNTQCACFRHFMKKVRGGGWQWACLDEDIAAVQLAWSHFQSWMTQNNFYIIIVYMLKLVSVLGLNLKYFYFEDNNYLL